MTSFDRQTRQIIDTVAGIQIDPKPATVPAPSEPETDERNKGVSEDDFKSFLAASDKELMRNIEMNNRRLREIYAIGVGPYADYVSKVHVIIGTAKAILHSRDSYQRILEASAAAAPKTCAHEDHDCYGQCYTCGGYTKAGDVSHFMP